MSKKSCYCRRDWEICGKIPIKGSILYVRPNGLTDDDKEFINRYSLDELIKASESNKNSQCLKHLIALLICTRYKNPKFIKNGDLLTRDYLFENLHPNTVMVYRTSGLKVLSDKVPYGNISDEKMVDIFPYGINVEREGFYKYWLSYSSVSLLKSADNKGNYLIATKLLLESWLISELGLEGFLKKEGLSEKEIIDLIIRAHENGDYVTLAQYFKIADLLNNTEDKDSQVKSAVNNIRQETDYSWLKPLNEMEGNFVVLHNLSQKDELKRSESTILGASRIIIYGKYGNPSEQCDLTMMNLLRFSSLDEYKLFKEYFLRIRQVGNIDHNNPSIEDWLKQERLKRRKEG